MEKGTKKKIAIGLGVAVLAYFGFKAFGGKKLSPFEKMALDVLNPNTTAGQSQRAYLRNNGLNSEDRDMLLSFVSYRQANPSDTFAQAYNAKPSWTANEVVPV